MSLYCFREPWRQMHNTTISLRSRYPPPWWGLAERSWQESNSNKGRGNRSVSFLLHTSASTYLPSTCPAGLPEPCWPSPTDKESWQTKQFPWTSWNALLRARGFSFLLPCARRGFFFTAGPPVHGIYFLCQHWWKKLFSDLCCYGNWKNSFAKHHGTCRTTINRTKQQRRSGGQEHLCCPVCLRPRPLPPPCLIHGLVVVLFLHSKSMFPFVCSN